MNIFRENNLKGIYETICRQVNPYLVPKKSQPILLTFSKNMIWVSQNTNKNKLITIANCILSKQKNLLHQGIRIRLLLKNLRRFRLTPEWFKHIFQ